MFSRKIEFYMLDVLIAIDKIKRYTLKFSNGEELLFDELRWDATIRELEIIGEATKNLLNCNVLIDKKYRRIVDFRNQINHGYFGIDENIVWDVVENKLDEYRNELDKLIIDLQIDIKSAIDISKRENVKQKEVLLFLEQIEKQCK